MAAKEIENTKRFSVFVTEDQYEDLKQKAKDLGMTVSGYVRFLIINDLKKK